MLRVLKYYLRNIFVWKTTYFIPIIEILFLLLFSLILRDYKYGYLFNDNFFVYFLMFVISIVFVIAQVIHIFKKNDNDSLLLFLLSQPISKFKQIFAQMLSILITILFFAFFIFFFGLFAGFVDKNISNKVVALFAASILFGTLIIMTISASIIIFFSYWLSKSSIIFSGVITVFLIPIVSTTMQLVIQKPFNAFDNQKFFVVNNNIKKIGSGFSIKNLPSLTENSRIIYFDRTETKSPDFVQKNSWDSYSKSKYNTLIWLDPWAQLSGLYKSFINESSDSKKKWIRNSKKFSTYNNELKITLNNNMYGIIERYSENSLYQPKYEKLTLLISNIKYIGNIIKGDSKFQDSLNQFSFEQQVVFCDALLSETKKVVQINRKDMDNYYSQAHSSLFSSFFKDSSQYALCALFLFNNKQIFKISNKSDTKFNILKTFKDSTSSFKLIPLSIKYNQFISDGDILPKKWVITIWVIIFLLSSTTIPAYIYIYKRH